MARVGEVLAIDDWATNAHLIADVARLGYLDGLVFDATYGKHGGFWKVWRPDALVTNDLRHPAAHAWDYRDVPLPDGSFDAVVFDPDYKLKGTPALGDQDVRYGTDRRTTRAEVMGQMRDGAVECYRLTRRFLLVKCMDGVEGGQMRWQTDLVTKAIEDRCLCGRDQADHPYGMFLPTCRGFRGGRKVDRFDFVPVTAKIVEGKPVVVFHGRAQPDDGRAQKTARHRNSTLLVFRKPKPRRSRS